MLIKQGYFGILSLTKMDKNSLIKGLWKRIAQFAKAVESE
jgi:hypothetical protein